MSEKGARQKQRNSHTTSKTSQRRNTTKVTKPTQYMHAHHKEHGPPSAHNQVHKGSITDPKPDRTASSRRDQSACENPVHEGQFIRRNGSAIHINESDTHMNRNHKQTPAPSRRYKSGSNQTLNVRPRRPTRKPPYYVPNPDERKGCKAKAAQIPNKQQNKPTPQYHKGDKALTIHACPS